MNIDDERTRRGEARDQQLDPRGIAPARPADEDEPRAWPSSDRQKMETTANKVEHGEPEQPQAEPYVQPRRQDLGPDIPSRPVADGRIELPVLGYPNSEQGLTFWFRSTYFRAPPQRELGSLMNAMNQRDSTPQQVGPEPDTHGWEAIPSAPPATR